MKTKKNKSTNSYKIIPYEFIDQYVEIRFTCTCNEFCEYIGIIVFFISDLINVGSPICEFCAEDLEPYEAILSSIDKPIKTNNPFEAI